MWRQKGWVEGNSSLSEGKLDRESSPETLSFGRANFTCTKLKVKTDFLCRMGRSPSPPHSIPPSVIFCKIFNLSVFHPRSSLFHKIDEQGGFSNSSLVIKGVKAWESGGGKPFAYEGELGEGDFSREGLDPASFIQCVTSAFLTQTYLADHRKNDIQTRFCPLKWNNS